MLSSPYPVPPLWSWTVAMILGAVQGLGAGLWVIISPPKSYVGIGATLTLTWGILIVTGSALVLIAHFVRVHQLEIPGIVFVLGGLAIYVYRSWQATFGDSPGSGPRAFFLGWLLCFLLTRLVLLVYVDWQACRRLEIREGADG